MGGDPGDRRRVPAGALGALRAAAAGPGGCADPAGPSAAVVDLTRPGPQTRRYRRDVAARLRAWARGAEASGHRAAVDPLPLVSGPA
ncbi:hypothetical protein MICRO80W_430002 [Micrococcus luteus]|nr:hypothetical protein MICRO80W_430002 [Micrococcus luteus]